MLHLILALLWLVGGIAVLIQERMSGTKTSILGTDFSLAWLFFLLFLYNMVRWWVRFLSRRVARAEREAMTRAEIRSARRRAEREEEEGSRELNPDFIFTDPSPEEAERGSRGEGEK